MERERDDWRQTASDQVRRIKQLEEVLEPRSKQLSDAEALHSSVEYQKSFAVPIGLCFTAAHIKRSNSQEHGDTQEHVIHPDTNSFHFAHDEDNGEDAATYRFVPDLGLHEVLSSLSNCEVIRRTYQSLGQRILSHGELLKRHERLNRDHVDLYNHSKTQLEELNRLRNDLQREMQMERKRDDWRRTASDQVRRIKQLEEVLEPRSMQLSDAEA
ncbi:hypothetical protein Tco_0670385 [Tanacetum coccineum]